MDVRNLWGKLFRVERNRLGQFTYSFLDNNGFNNSDDYLKLSFCNPVLATIIALRCKVYSQMKITHYNANGEEIKNSPYIKLFKQPNYFQSQEDFFFQQMWFLSATGNNLTYNVKALNEVKAMYNLLPSAIDLNKTNKINKLIVTDADFKAYGEKFIKYTIEDKVWDYKIKDLIPFYDLTNGLTECSFMSSPSRVKGISKILENIDENLLSKNVNLKMTQKYLASNKSTGNEAQIQDNDRKDIFSKISQKALMITNASMDVKHLVSDMKRLYLDEQFADDANKCLLAFDMNKNVLNYFSKDSTFENQNQGIISWIQNSIQNSADNTMNSFSSSLGLIDKGEYLKASYDHLPIMGAVLNEKITSFGNYQNGLKTAIEIGTLSTEEAKQMSNDFKLKIGL